MRQRESAASKRDSSGGGGLVVAPVAAAAGGCGDFDGDDIALEVHTGDSVGRLSLRQAMLKLVEACRGWVTRVRVCCLLSFTLFFVLSSSLLLWLIQGCRLSISSYQSKVLQYNTSSLWWRVFNCAAIVALKANF